MPSKATENIDHELSSPKNVPSSVTLLKLKKKQKQKNPRGSSFQLAKNGI